MSAFSANTARGDYDLHSLQHERRMLAIYRRAAPNDARLLQPLANACWRAANFEWALYRDAETVRRLWGEGALALASGFARRRSGFDPNPEQLILALHIAIAAREREAFKSLAFIAPDLRTGALREAMAFRNSSAHFHLAEGYTLVARALVEGKQAPARAAAEALDAARAENDSGWWERQFPNPLEAAWRESEHEAVCALLGAVAHKIADEPTGVEDVEAANRHAERQAAEFARVIDDALLRLEQFIKRDDNHHPKLYVWLPGLALCALAASARLPVDWLPERCESRATGYERLPLELLRQPN
jgi:hypothetical protein